MYAQTKDDAREALPPLLTSVNGRLDVLVFGIFWNSLTHGLQYAIENMYIHISHRKMYCSICMLYTRVSIYKYNG